MEDISRDLEREIARSKPKPYKQDRKTRVFIVDDFGLMKSGEYLKSLVTILSIISLVCFVAAVLFYNLYSGLSQDADFTENKLVLAEKQVDELIKEKEVLMARLVISGKEPGIEKVSEKEDKPIVDKVEEKKPLVSKNEEIIPIPLEPEDGDKIKKSSMVEQEKIIIKPKLNTISESLVKPAESEMPAESEIPRVVKQTVSVEKFTVTKDGIKGDLLVRFDIRNISKEQGDEDPAGAHLLCQPLRFYGHLQTRGCDHRSAA